MTHKQHPLKRNKKLILAGIAIIIGAFCMRLAWFFIRDPIGPVMVILGGILFVGGVIAFVLRLYKQKHRF